MEGVLILKYRCRRCAENKVHQCRFGACSYITELARPCASLRRDVSSCRRIEIAQVRRALIFSGRHQKTVGAEEIIVPADDDVIVVLAALVLVPDDLAFLADIALRYGPGAHEGMVDGRDLV